MKFIVNDVASVSTEHCGLEVKWAKFCAMKARNFTELQICMFIKFATVMIPYSNQLQFKVKSKRITKLEIRVQLTCPPPPIKSLNKTLHYLSKDIIEVDKVKFPFLYKSSFII